MWIMSRFLQNPWSAHFALKNDKMANRNLVSKTLMHWNGSENFKSETNTYSGIWSHCLLSLTFQIGKYYRLISWSSLWWWVLVPASLALVVCKKYSKTHNAKVQRTLNIFTNNMQYIVCRDSAIISLSCLRNIQSLFCNSKTYFKQSLT